MAQTPLLVPSTTDRLVENATAYARNFEGPGGVVPAKHLAIVTCMDVRIDPTRIFGLGPGDAHIVRNAGGLVSDDVLRSLVISQRLLGTREVIVMLHTECGLHGRDERSLVADVASEVGSEPTYAFGAFSDLDAAARSAVAAVRAHPFLSYRDRVRGFVYDVATGQLREVT